MKKQVLQLNGGNNKNDRRSLDYYPTPSEVTIALMEFLKLPPMRIWECACGDGAMSKVIKEYGHQVFSSDIRHTGYGRGGIDFINFEPRQKFDAIITNPPFSQAEIFIKRALQFTPIVAMLVKSQFWHAKTRLELFKVHPPTWVLPLSWRPDFLAGEKGGRPTMECIWTVWIEPINRFLKSERITKYSPLLKPKIVSD